MSVTFSSILRLVFVVLFLSLGACGGGGGDGSGNVDEGKVDDDQGTIPDDPASKQLAPLDTSSLESFGDAFLTHVQIGHMLSVLVPPLEHGKTGSVDETYAGWLNGTMHLTGEQNSDGSGSVNIEFKNLALRGYDGGHDVRFNGNATVEYHTPAYEGMVDATITSKDLFYAYDGELYRIGGKLNVIHGVHGVSAVLGLRLYTGEIDWRSEQMHVVYEYLPEYEGRLRVSGKFIKAGSGYVDAVTGLPAGLMYDGSGFESLQKPGNFVLSGADGVRMELDLLDGGFGAYAFDADGDGGIETAIRGDWIHPAISDYSGNGVRPLPIAAGFLRSDGSPVLVGRSFELEGRYSVPAPGKPVSYLWDVFRAPPNSTAVFEGDVTIANPRFIPDVPGVYIFSLYVTDGETTTKDFVKVHVVTEDETVEYASDTTSMGADFSAPVGVEITLPRMMDVGTWELHAPYLASTNDYSDSTEFAFTPVESGFFDINGTRVAVRAEPFFTTGFALENNIDVVTDMNGDGFDDYIYSVAQYSETSMDGQRVVTVVYNQGGGHSTTSEFRVPSASASTAMVDDINGDGLKDIVLPDYALDDLHVYVADGESGFAPLQILSIPFWNCEDPRVAQQPDAEEFLYVSCADGKAGVWKWAGSEYVAATMVDNAPFSERFVQLDFNGDGFMDVVSVTYVDYAYDTLEFWAGQGDNTFVSVDSQVVRTISKVQVEDIDSDGDQDLMVVKATMPSNGHELLVFRQQATGGFADPESFHPQWWDGEGADMVALALKDLNDDGLLDLTLLPSNSTGIGFWLQTKEQEFVLSHRMMAYAGGKVMYADMNGDGIDDMVTGNAVNFGGPTP